MAQLTLKLLNTLNQRLQRVSLPDNVAIKDFIPFLLEELNLPAGYHYTIRPADRQIHLSARKTLSESDVLPGTTLLLECVDAGVLPKIQSQAGSISTWQWLAGGFGCVMMLAGVAICAATFFSLI